MAGNALLEDSWKKEIVKCMNSNLLYTRCRHNKDQIILKFSKKMLLYSIYYISVGSSTCFDCWHPSSGAGTAVQLYSFWYWLTGSTTMRSRCWVRLINTNSWLWVSTAETCRAAYRNVINWIQSHLVGQLLNSIHDEWTHVYKNQISSVWANRHNLVSFTNIFYFVSCTNIFYFVSCTNVFYFVSCTNIFYFVSCTKLFYLVSCTNLFYFVSCTNLFYFFSCTYIFFFVSCTNIFYFVSFTNIFYFVSCTNIFYFVSCTNIFYYVSCTNIFYFVSCTNIFYFVSCTNIFYFISSTNIFYFSFSKHGGLQATYINRISSFKNHEV